jgi:deoxyribodipyrimidine photo-lyase
MSVFSPFLRKWVSKILDDSSYLSPSQKPAKNPTSAKGEFRQLFSTDIPRAPSSHSLSEGDQKRFAALWLAGEHEAQARLEKFCAEKIHDYATHRSEPSSDSSSCLSVHLSQGTLSARACIRHARASNTSNRLDKGKPGVVSWVSEVAWRDFYRRFSF